MIKTRYPELLLGTPAPGSWRFADSASGSFVGPFYASKAEALADLEGYARRGGWVKDPPADDALDQAVTALRAYCNAMITLANRVGVERWPGGPPGFSCYNDLLQQCDRVFQAQDGVRKP